MMGQSAIAFFLYFVIILAKLKKTPVTRVITNSCNFFVHWCRVLHMRACMHACKFMHQLINHGQQIVFQQIFHERHPSVFVWIELYIYLSCVWNLSNVENCRSRAEKLRAKWRRSRQTFQTASFGWSLSRETVVVYCLWWLWDVANRTSGLTL